MLSPASAILEWSDKMNEYVKVSKYYIGAFVLYFITGLVMCIWPNLTMQLAGTALGIGMLVVGIVHIIVYFTKDHFDGIMHMDLTIGVVLAAFGAFMLIHKDFVGMAIPFGTGILLMIGGISKIQHALDMKKMYFNIWKAVLVVAIILIAAGIILIFDPFREKVLIYFIASFLMIDGLVSIIIMLMMSHRSKQLAKGWTPKERKSDAKKGAVAVPGNYIDAGQAQQASGSGAVPAAPVVHGPQPSMPVSPPSAEDGIPEVPDHITLEIKE